MSAIGHVEREAALQAEIELLRAERNLLREMFNSAEKELAAERERYARLETALDDCIHGRRDWMEKAKAAIRKGDE